MIKINGEIIKQNNFPDGSLLIKHNPREITKNNLIRIRWYFENNEELWMLYALTRHIQSNGFGVELFMPYCVNGRQDRVKHDGDIFTLKWFAEVINYLNFNKVYILDPHSSVSGALINNVGYIYLWKIVYSFITSVSLSSENNEIIIYFPDSNAAKKYEDMFIDRGYKTCYGIKHRDWDTGQISGLEVISNGLDLKGKTVLMFDDIISYGGSMYYAALELKKLGVDKIFAYASHTENSILNKEKGTLIKLLNDGTVERLFTTDSIFTGEHEKISVMEL